MNLLAQIHRSCSRGSKDSQRQHAYSLQHQSLSSLNLKAVERPNFCPSWRAKRCWKIAEIDDYELSYLSSLVAKRCNAIALQQWQGSKPGLSKTKLGCWLGFR